ncbi:AAA family ATPase [Streptomyces sp. NPDC057253]|uniref:nSTAND1 domain-containing NTPase n=1 Tax=Streptomyces sp. NPDC057253 TaxID=3346069 RepID=UPI0036455A82
MHRSADALTRILTQRCGLDPTRLLRITDPESPADILDPLTARARGATEGLLFYFIGHGSVAHGPESALLVTAKAARRDFDDTSLPSESLRFGELTRALEPVGRGLLMIVLDCCHSGVAQSSGEFADSRLHALAEREARANVLLTAAAQGWAFAPRDAEHTAFTGEVVRFLEGGDATGHRLLTVGALAQHLTRASSAGTLRSVPRYSAHNRAETVVLAHNPAYDPETLCQASDLGHPECPYPGLTPFDNDDTSRFHGRQTEVAELTRHLANRLDEGPVLITGASGIGKTSLLRAGLLPALAAGRGLPEAARWPQLTVSVGRHPFASLARALLGRREGEHSGSVLELTRRLAADPTALARELTARAERLAARDEQGDPVRHLLVVDQLEEVFQRHDEETAEEKSERRVFLQALVNASTAFDTTDGSDSTGSDHRTAPAAAVVMAVQHSHLHALLSYEFLESTCTLGVGMYLLRVLDAERLEEVIVRPAHIAGHDISAELIAQLKADAAPHSGARADFDSGVLPLLSHALRATWEGHSGPVLHKRDYDRTGGLGQSIAREANAFYRRLASDQDREMARRILVELVHWTGDTESTVRRMPTGLLRGAFPDGQQEAFRSLLDQLKRHRLVTEGEHHVQLVHRSLLTGWAELREWVEQEHDGEPLLKMRLEAAATEWEREPRDQLLWQGGDLSDAQQWADRQLTPVRSHVRDFLTASAGRSRRLRRRRVLLGALLACLMVLGGGTGFLVSEHLADQEARREKAARRLLAESESLRAADPALAAQLALGAHRTHTDADSRDALLTTASAQSSVQLTAQGPDISSLAFDATGARLVAAGGGRVRVWPVGAAGPGRPSSPVGVRQPTVAVFRPDGKRLAVDTREKVPAGTMDRAHVALLSASPGARRDDRALSQAFNGRVTGIAFRHDSRRLALTFAPGFTVVLDAESGAAVTGAWTSWQIAGDAGPVVYGRDGDWVAVGAEDGSVIVLDGSGERRTTAVHHTLPGIGPVRTLALSPDGSLLVAGHDNGTVSRWRMSDEGRHAEALPADPVLAGDGPVVGLAFTGDGAELLVAHRDRTIRVFSTRADRLTAELRTPDPLDAVALSPDGRTVAASSGPRLVLRSLPDPDLRRQPDPVTVLAVRPDGGLVAAGGTDGSVHLWRPGPNRSMLPAGGLPGSAAERGSTTALAFGGKGDSLLVSGHAEGAVLLWRATAPGRRPLIRLRTTDGAPVTSVALSRDGSLLVAGTARGRVVVWNLHDVDRIPRPVEVAGHAGAVTGMAFLGGSDELAICSEDGTVDVWGFSDRRMPDQALKLAGTGPGRPRALSTSGDGTTVAVAQQDGSVTVWDLTGGGRSSIRLPGSEGNLTAVALGTGERPGNRTLAALGEDGTVRVWASHRPGVWTADGRLGAAAPGATAIAFASGRSATLGSSLVAVTAEGRIGPWFSDAPTAAAWVCAAPGASTTARLWHARYPVEAPCTAAQVTR